MLGGAHCHNLTTWVRGVEGKEGMETVVGKVEREKEVGICTREGWEAQGVGSGALEGRAVTVWEGEMEEGWEEGGKGVAEARGTAVKGAA